MQKVTLLVNDLKSLPDSNDPKKKEYVANVSVLELAKADIPTDANPRKQDQKSRVFKEIKESVLSFDNIFRYKTMEYLLIALLLYLITIKQNQLNLVLT